MLAGVSALSLIHHDVQYYAEQLVGHLHLNPAKHYPQISIEAITHLTDCAFFASRGMLTRSNPHLYQLALLRSQPMPSAGNISSNLVMRVISILHR